MAVRAPRRLPGIRFEVAAPPLPEELPRMDVAAFVGFAASGPIDVPVAVEDIAQFHAIFGEDVPIAWEASRGATVYGNLAAAVRAFFRDGGERCWVVRVARRPDSRRRDVAPARANVFRLPGLFAYRADNHSVTPASAVARSEGSWSDTLRVATALESRDVPVLSQRLERGELVLGVSAATDLAVGDLLLVSFSNDQRVVYLPLDSLEILDGSAALPEAGSNVRRLSRLAVRVSSARPLWFEPAANGAPVLAAQAPEGAHRLEIRSCERLAFELLWRWGDGQPSRLSGLGFCPPHPRFWAALPTDRALYTSGDLPAEPGGLPAGFGDVGPHGEFQQEAADPRVPLAGAPGSSELFLPLSMTPVPLEWSESGADPGDALVRDGLSRFDADLFLDLELVDATVNGLGARADYLRYQSPNPRRLRGIHALLEVEEATLVAVPDAALRGWSARSLAAPPPPEPPDPLPPAPVGPCGEARNEDRTFVDCDVHVPTAPQLSAPDEADALGSYALSWSSPAGVEYTLEEALRPDYEHAVSAYVGAAHSIQFWGRAPGAYYYRVRARAAGRFSAWSEGRVVSVRPAGPFQIEEVEQYRPETLLAVQRSLLRLCAARGDLLAALAMPEHYLEDDAIAHAAQLQSPLATTSGVAPIGFGEATALSFGAVYHPWLIGREESRPDELRSTPPDGAALGILARRAISRGAWVAPANELLAGVVALKTRVAPARLSALYDAQVNIFRKEPRGFLTLGADTLSLDSELLPINVRRLLILVRRAALRLGQTYVFEPNDATFRRLIERSFESLLGQMYALGAFAGASADKAFQVVTGPALNPPASVDLGRFIVELRVAPSLPLSFITLRLVQSGDRSHVTEER
jgi:hypothetical protein